MTQPKCAVTQRLADLGIELPAPCLPAGNYKPAVICGNLLYVSGHTPDDAHPATVDAATLGWSFGTVGVSITKEQAHKAARDVALAILATVKHACGGDFRRVKRLVRATGVVACGPDFSAHPKVMDGFSNLMAEVFGAENGIGARSATGASSLPGNVPVEVTEAIFELHPE